MYLNENDIEKLEKRFYEDDFNEYLEKIIKMDMIEKDFVKDIAEIVLTEGYDSLSENQRRAFIFYAIKPNYKKKCNKCGTEILWSEMIEAVKTGLCGYCLHIFQKDKER
ncbi:hypothetical protein Calkro_1121 [Caldicellulosiruptor kronotskyensis 2002]|uniref:Uncharacterized protein n=1 Tax=Caldicellulosiruptor kronotskyensis (strain DSM 18902 / VKM B-2412 / 2002) TaxID=632348 RepID=E4SCX0_CALK2|nr:hypothetical protein [Caldicellulosiruptor kronotskyensis]ADQ45986.1 hypothetical protein Calkro_1121 [Caldicellulosiruptor kronotskyensis 2002]